MPHGGVLESFIVIFAGAAVLATLSLYTRQPMLVAYVALGIILGPHGAALVSDPALLADMAEFGIIFLLFLVGLDLPPAKLRNMFSATFATALLSTVVFFGVGFGLLYLFGYSTNEALIGGLAAVFSSTILGIKLLPTTALHHRHIGEVVVSLLLIQDLFAIIAILLLNSLGSAASASAEGLSGLVGTVFLGLPALAGIAFLGVRFVVLPLLRKFDAFHEYIFLLAIGWCVSIAGLAHSLDLSFEIGAFVAGVSLATSPISQYIAENLRPLRDFFLVLFFFSVGAGLQIDLLGDVWMASVCFALALVVVKPPVFALLLSKQAKQMREVSWEVGFRLGQASEFTLLLSFIALNYNMIGAAAGLVIQFATVLSLLVSSYLVIFRYPTPISPNPRLRRD